ncbi:MAG: SPOR domain-containing protein [Pyrinomonadaceae bacterium]
MQVICPNCERKGLLDAAALSEATTRACPGCGVPFRVRLLDLCDDADATPPLMPATINDFDNAARVARTVTLSSFARLSHDHAPAHLFADEDLDVLSLPDDNAPAALPDAPPPAPTYDDTRDEAHDVPARVGVLDLRADLRARANEAQPAPEARAANEAAFADEHSLPDEPSPVRVDSPAPRHSSAREDSSAAEGSHADPRADEVFFEPAPRRARPADAVDKYRFAVRVMNASPLWLVAAGVAFVALVLVFDLLLAPATRALGDTASLAAPQNQATNRDAARQQRARDERSRDARPGDESQDADAARPADDSAPKPAAVSEPAESESAAPAVAASSAEPASPAGEAGAGSPPRLTIQTGAYRLESQANDHAEALRAAGFDVRVVEERNSKRPWYFVQTGTFASRGEATARLSELSARGFGSQYTLREVN